MKRPQRANAIERDRAEYGCIPGHTHKHIPKQYDACLWSVEYNFPHAKSAYQSKKSLASPYNHKSLSSKTTLYYPDNKAPPQAFTSRQITIIKAFDP